MKLPFVPPLQRVGPVRVDAHAGSSWSSIPSPRSPSSPLPVHRGHSAPGSYGHLLQGQEGFIEAPAMQCPQTVFLLLSALCTFFQGLSTPPSEKGPEADTFAAGSTL